MRGRSWEGLIGMRRLGRVVLEGEGGDGGGVACFGALQERTGMAFWQRGIMQGTICMS